jgi:hypothetical protein
LSLGGASELFNGFYIASGAPLSSLVHHTKFPPTIHQPKRKLRILVLLGQSRFWNAGKWGRSLYAFA